MEQSSRIFQLSSSNRNSRQYLLIRTDNLQIIYRKQSLGAPNQYPILTLPPLLLLPLIKLSGVRYVDRSIQTAIAARGMAASKILDDIFICYDSQSEKQRKTVPSKKQSICSPVNLPAPPLTYTSHALLYLFFQETVVTLCQPLSSRLSIARSEKAKKNNNEIKKRGSEGGPLSLVSSFPSLRASSPIMASEASHVTREQAAKLRGASPIACGSRVNSRDSCKWRAIDFLLSPKAERGAQTREKREWDVIGTSAQREW